MNNFSGALGENYVADFIKSKGYNILKRNYHSRFGEIDIIAEDRKYIMFIEVKTRTAKSIVNPFEAVTRQKQHKIIKTAMCYLQESSCRLQPRFDVAGVITDVSSGKVVSVKYLENAFGCGSFR